MSIKHGLDNDDTIYQMNNNEVRQKVCNQNDKLIDSAMNFYRLKKS